jgi:hypothetical protein
MRKPEIEIRIFQGRICCGMAFSVLSFLRADMVVIFVSSAVWEVWR